MLYLILTVVVGLVQVWAVMAYLAFSGAEYSYWELLKDGGLFFFASSLSVSSFINHFNLSGRVRRKEILVSFVVMFVIVVICLTGYFSAVHLKMLGPNTPLEDLGGKESFVVSTERRIQNIGQVVVTAVAILYGLYIENRTKRGENYY